MRAGLILLIHFFSVCYGATFGTVTPVVGGVADIVLDEGRQRLYLVNTNRNQVEVYSIQQRRFLTPIPVEQQPLAAAISRNGAVLYVTSHVGTSLNIINLETLAVTSRISLPARPEGVAVGSDERVLISTVGTGAGNVFNVLLIYDPFAPAGGQAIIPVTVPPPPPANPLAPPNNFNRPALTNRSFLETSRDGRYIIGVNIPNANSRAVFVYESASGVVLRSRTVGNVSSVLSVAPDGSRFMAGLNLFETETLTILAQQNAANAPYPFANGTNFNTQQNQGGSVYAPSGQRIYSAFNFAPVTSPASRANVSQLMINDPENLLIQTALQMPENLAGKMVISADGANLYAICESGFLSIPIGQMDQNPIADLDQRVVLLANDQCGVTADQQTVRLEVRNRGRGRLTASTALLQLPNVGPGGVGGAGGAGGGAPGGGVVIIIPPIAGGGGVVVPPGAQLPGGQQTGQNAGVAGTAPRVQVQNTATSAALTLGFNTANRGVGTVSPVHQFVVQSNEAINIPPTIQIYQNFRNSESRGDLVTMDVGLSANEGLVDLVLDSARQRLYIANSGMNRVEVFDTRTRTLLAPIRVGQLPRSMAFAPDGQTLYVANSGGESISIIDLEKREVVGRVKFPALPFNGNAALLTPQLIAAGQRGPLVMMNDGSLWRIIGNEAVPRAFNASVLPVANGRQIITAPRTMAAAPNGEVILLFSSGNGTAYLYDATIDDFVQSRQIVANNVAGYRGPVSVGPRGQYFLVNDQILNPSLTPIGNSGGGIALPGGTAGGATTPRPVAAVTSIGVQQFARFIMPTIANANAVAALTDAGTVEVVDANTGLPVRTASALERPTTTAVGNAGVPVNGRTMAVEPNGATAYVLTSSGLSIVPLDAQPPTARPTTTAAGIVNTVSYSPQLAQGGLISIFGRNLADSATAPGAPLPLRLGGVCVTMNNNPLPLLMTSPDQINAYLPQELAAGRFPVVVRSIDRKTASNAATVTVVRNAPAVFFEPDTKRALIFHADGKPITKDNPAKRDRPIVMYAASLGPTTPVVRGAVAAPSSPLAEAADVQVFFGDPRINGAEIIVDWAGLVPGYVGLYQLNLRVPGNHLRGEALPVTLRMGSVSSPAGPVIAVD